MAHTYLNQIREVRQQIFIATKQFLQQTIWECLEDERIFLTWLHPPVCTSGQ